MDRSKRTAVVVGIAVILAAVATLGMYRIVSQMPASGRRNRDRALWSWRSIRSSSARG